VKGKGKPGNRESSRQRIADKNHPEVNGQTIGEEAQGQSKGLLAKLDTLSRDEP
ncbi:uncharacterized protein METZ01_LOCUS282875, partial [marine metagenome]